MAVRFVIFSDRETYYECKLLSADLEMLKEFVEMRARQILRICDEAHAADVRRVFNATDSDYITVAFEFRD